MIFLFMQEDFFSFECTELHSPHLHHPHGVLNASWTTAALVSLATGREGVVMATGVLPIALMDLEGAYGQALVPHCSEVTLTLYFQNGFKQRRRYGTYTKWQDQKKMQIRSIQDFV